MSVGAEPAEIPWATPPESAHAPGSTITQEDRAHHLYTLLRGSSQLRMFRDASTAALLFLAGWFAAVFVALLLDAVLALPAPIRIAIDIALLASLPVLGWLVLRSILAHRFEPRRAARQVEEQLGSGNSTLINAVEFTASPAGRQSLMLRDRAIRMAEEKSRRLTVLEVVPLTRLYHATGWLAATLLVIGLAWLIAPRMFAMVLPRYWQPLASHPPYTLVTFEVVIDPEPVYHGRPVTIEATLGGPEQVEQAELVFVDELNGYEAVPMFPLADDRFVLELEEATRSRQFFINTPQGRSELMSLDVLAVPFFEDIQIQLNYPEYTGWAPQRQRLDQRGIRTLAGTEVTITIRSNLPLEHGRLGFLGRQQRLVPRTDDSTVVSGTTALHADGEITLTLVSDNGVDSLEPVRIPVTVVADGIPRVAIAQPQQHIVVVENWTVPVTVEAIDDVAIARLTLHRSVNGWGPSPVELPLEPLAGGLFRARGTFDLAALGARAGDVITYYATAEDTHPDPPHFADTPTCVIQVISEEQYAQFARQRYQMDEMIDELEAIRSGLEQLHEQREAALEELETLQKRLEDSPDDPETVENIRVAQVQLEAHADRMQQLADRLEKRTAQPELYDLEQPWNQMLQTLRKNLEQQAASADALAETLRQMQEGGLTPAQIRHFTEQLDQLQQEQQPLDDRQRQQLDAARDDLDLFRMADDLLTQTERLRSVIQQQRELTNRMAELKDTPSLPSSQQDRADSLAREQDAIREELDDIVQQMQQAAEAAQDRLPMMAASALGLCQSIGELQIPEDQQQAAAKARERQGEAAHQHAHSAAENLESLVAQCPDCQDAAGEIHPELDGPLSLSRTAIRNTLEQLAQSRSIPGLGNPGQGHGRSQTPGDGQHGQGGTSGSSTGGQAQSSPFWNPGQTSPGPQAEMPVLGPRMQVDDSRERPSGQLGADERGSFLPGHDNTPLAGPESINPETRTGRLQSIGILRGVPVPFRPDAEAYFRRLAEDEATLQSRP